MPGLPFVLPHWLYWSTLALFPLVAMYFVARQLRKGTTKNASLFIAYMFWLCSGFLGLHRFYLRNGWGVLFIPVFFAILFTTDQIRDRREDVSRTRAAAASAQSELERARIPSNVAATPAMNARLAKARTADAAAQAEFGAARGRLGRWQQYSSLLAMLMAGMLLGDAIMLPWLVRSANARDGHLRPEGEPPSPAQHIEPDHARGGPVLIRASRAIEAVNTRVGEFVAYWAVLSVFAYYYEVIARFAFNSPTNWVHESMFLMYGMQYMLAGAYAYRYDQHVRVDVLYARFSPRGKAAADVFTSIFFFMFAGTLLWTSGRFALDSLNPGGAGELSFTEWGIQYWPVKLMMPIGAALLVLQGLAKLAKDLCILTEEAH